MNTIQEQISQLSDEEFRELKAWAITTETTRREQEPAVRAAKQEIVKEYQEAGVLPAPEYATEAVEVEKAAAWADPGTDHALMYPAGAVVQHSGKLWRSGVDLNSWEPGAEGVHGTVWADVTPKPAPTLQDGEEAEDVSEPSTQVYEDSRDYQTGDVVEYDGSLYECTGDHHAASGWTPVNAHAYWKKTS